MVYWNDYEIFLAPPEWYEYKNPVVFLINKGTV